MFASRLSLRFQLSKNNPFLKAWLGLKRIVPIISSDLLRKLTSSGGYEQGFKDNYALLKKLSEM